MTDIVVDASAAAAWLLKSQRTSASMALAASWPEHRGFAPYLFLTEVRAFLLAAERRERSGTPASMERLAVLAGFDIEVLPPLDGAWLDEVLVLARGCGASFTDAHYLELALQLGAAVATRDGGMVTAAKRFGLHVFDLRQTASH